MNVLSDYSLLRHNTFAIDAKAAEFIEYESVDELRSALDYAHGCADKYARKPLFIGRGSNLLFTRDYDGCVMHGNIDGIETVDEHDGFVYVRVGAAVLWDDFVDWCVNHNAFGVENLSLIPGEVGAACVQNIGAYGSEVADIVYSVETLSIADLSEHEYSNTECKYAYRRSFFKSCAGEHVVHHAVFRLHSSFHPNLKYKALEQKFSDSKTVTAQNVRDYVIEMRKSKLPDPNVLGNAGSFFVNPTVSTEKYEAISAAYSDVPHFNVPGGVKIPAAWLIQQCGLKGVRTGNVGVYDKQPLVIVNYGGASADEIVAISNMVISEVQKRFGIKLKPEVQFV